MPQAEPLPVDDHCMEPGIVLDVLDKDAFSDRLPELGRARQPRGIREGAHGAVAVPANPGLEHPLPLDEGLRLFDPERNSIEASDGVAQCGEQRDEPLVARWGRSEAPERTPPASFRPAQHLQCLFRVESDAQTELGKL